MIALDPPASPASGSVLLTSTANDAHSGLDTIEYEYSAAGANDWRTTALTGALWDTTQLADGAYDVRARATDRSGNVSGWSVVNGIAVDNAPPTVSVTAPLDGSFVNARRGRPVHAGRRGERRRHGRRLRRVPRLRDGGPDLLLVDERRPRHDAGLHRLLDAAG